MTELNVSQYGRLPVIVKSGSNNRFALLSEGNYIM